MERRFYLPNMPHTLQQLEAFVSSPHYDATTAGLIALGVPDLPRFKGEQIAPGITRIRGNLCNVHGRYGPCDKAKSGGKKPAKGRKPAAPKKTEQQRAAERTASQEARQAENTKQQAINMTKVGEATGLEDHLSNLDQFGQGKPIRPQDEATLVEQGLLERGTDGTARVTEQGRVLLTAAKRGDVQRARDAMSRGRDQVSATAGRATARQSRAQAAAERTRAAEAKRQQREQERAKRQAAKKPTGGSKKPEARAVERPRQSKPAKRVRRNQAPSIGSVASSAPKKRPSPSPSKSGQPAKAPAKQIAPALQESVQALSDGKELSEADTQSLIRNGLAKLNKDGQLILTAAGMRATTKSAHNPEQQTSHGKSDTESHYRVGPGGARQAAQSISHVGVVKHAPSIAPSFQVFKDASGRYRWVAQSSTAFQDRDKEIVSTKALADDCAFADQTGTYGPLRWWHTPGLDLGDCDFNAMHGRVLIESGTFKSEQIALKVAAAAPQLEISLGFLHLPTEPDASGVFHHIRRFERSLVPRGKASNRFTAFSVKETPMLDTIKIAALKALGFSVADIAELQAQAAATEKSADTQQVAYKADEPIVYHGLNKIVDANLSSELPELVINGVTYKAFPPSPPTAEDAVTEEEAVDEMPMEEEAVGGLTLSPEDLQAIGGAIAEAIGPAIAQVMGALDLEKKVAGHVQGLMQPYQQAQATKDTADAERAEQVAALQTALKSTQDQLNELLGLQPAVKAERATESSTTTINPWIPQDAQLMESIKHQVSPNDQFAFGDLVENLFGNQTPGQA